MAHSLIPAVHVLAAQASMTCARIDDLVDRSRDIDTDGSSFHPRYSSDLHHIVSRSPQKLEIPSP
jgi:hypothetical protein